MLPSSVLPTAEDILRKCEHILSENKGHRSSIETLVGYKQNLYSHRVRRMPCIKPCLVAAIINPWFRSGFPTILAISVRDKTWIHIKKQIRVLSSNLHEQQDDRVQQWSKEVFWYRSQKSWGSYEDGQI